MKDCFQVCSVVRLAVPIQQFSINPSVPTMNLKIQATLLIAVSLARADSRAAEFSNKNEAYNFDEHNTDLADEDEIPYKIVCYDEIGEEDLQFEVQRNPNDADAT